MKTDRKAAAEARAAGARDATARPSQRRHAEDHDGPSAARTLARYQIRKSADGGRPVVHGVASVTEAPYEMWDMFGPYTEVVSASAFDATLAKDPMVEYTINHGAGGGMPMASTRAGTLVLDAVKDGEFPGLQFDATVNPARSDVNDSLIAMEDGDLAEASFKFTITRGLWSPDFTEYRIEETDINRGDVSTVNFGANPKAFSGVRAALGKLQQGRALDPQDVNMLTQAMAWFTAVDSIVDEAQEALAGYLGIPSPDPDDMPELSLPATNSVHRVLIHEDEIRHRSITR